MQESQQFRQSFLLLFMKLKWFLKRWRQGKVVHSEGEDFLEVQWAALEGGTYCWARPSCLHVPPRAVWVSPIPGQGLWVPISPQPWCHPQVNSMKELYLLLEEEELAPQQQADNKMCAGDTWTPNTVSRVPHEPKGWIRAGSAPAVAVWHGVGAPLGVHGWVGMLHLWMVPFPGGFPCPSPWEQPAGLGCREGSSHRVPPCWAPSCCLCSALFSCSPTSASRLWRT